MTLVPRVSTDKLLEIIHSNIFLADSDKFLEWIFAHDHMTMERFEDAFNDNQPAWKPLNERLGTNQIFRGCTNQPNERLQRMMQPRPSNMDANMPVLLALVNGYLNCTQRSSG